MDSIVGADEVRNAVESIDSQVTAAWPGIPAFRRGIRMSMELPDHEEPREDRWLTQIDARLPTGCLAPDGDLSCRGAHVDPASLLVASGRIGRLGVLPGLLEGTLDNRMLLQFCSSRRRQRSQSLQDRTALLGGRTFIRRLYGFRQLKVTGQRIGDRPTL